MSNKFSYKSFIEFVNSNFSMILIVLAVFIFGFSFGSMWKENKILGTDSEVAEVDDQAPAAPAPTKASSVNNMPELSSADHYRGAQNPTITLVEYSDYQCSFCSRVHPTMEELINTYPDQVAWVYRHYPLDAIHPQARQAAEVSECVAEYGSNEKFWEFTDTIMTSTDPEVAQLANLYAIVEEIGVNRQDIEACVESDEMAEVVDNQTQGGAAAGVRGTPATILVTEDGAQELISGAQPYEVFEQKIESYLN